MTIPLICWRINGAVKKIVKSSFNELPDYIKKSREI